MIFEGFQGNIGARMHRSGPKLYGKRSGFVLPENFDLY